MSQSDRCCMWRPQQQAVAEIAGQGVRSAAPPPGRRGRRARQAGRECPAARPSKLPEAAGGDDRRRRSGRRGGGEARWARGEGGENGKDANREEGQGVWGATARECRRGQLEGGNATVGGLGGKAPSGDGRGTGGKQPEEGDRQGDGAQATRKKKRTREGSAQYARGKKGGPVQSWREACKSKERVTGEVGV
ncbi:unnamed protein product [Pleuronectes platessa]|uniref:Uncharacterized protein n=1 Tax=Pleuronectes platessa TaxID=8262 RepID=A0A9N7U7N7_PLEPL|nr:unnamed protein product [Pleuronectes platessa]